MYIARGELQAQRTYEHAVAQTEILKTYTNRPRPVLTLED